ncbi:E02H1.6 [Ecytonucleospora hepatopenaei]|uniref:E02H1.6 n=1 Tax=Ecytonucleospora hepatopenaei TaxID=646526 RepID=A0A1W0E5T6_9MICR|nr:E02H1.6 [Ecytonucleospora hepatopenaei]
MAKFLVTGTPGTGKTTFCKKFTENNDGYLYVNSSLDIKENKLYDSFSTKHDSYEYSLNRVCDYFKNKIHKEKNVIFDTHDPEIVENLIVDGFFDIIIVVQCNLEVLYNRYVERGYSEDKISENLDCERFHEIKHITKNLVNKKTRILIYDSSIIESTKKYCNFEKIMDELNKIENS